MRVVIALCKCNSSKSLYGIRFEQIDFNSWEYTWAFPIKESAAKQEGFDKTTIKGTLIEGDEYPGCPFCNAIGFFLCSCGHLNCWNSKKKRVTCSWCGETGELSNGIDKIDVINNL